MTLARDTSQRYQLQRLFAWSDGWRALEIVEIVVGVVGVVLGPVHFKAMFAFLIYLGLLGVVGPFFERRAYIELNSNSIRIRGLHRTDLKYPDVRKVERYRHEPGPRPGRISDWLSRFRHPALTVSRLPTLSIVLRKPKWIILIVPLLPPIPFPLRLRTVYLRLSEEDTGRVVEHMGQRLSLTNQAVTP